MSSLIPPASSSSPTHSISGSSTAIDTLAHNPPAHAPRQTVSPSPSRAQTEARAAVLGTLHASGAQLNAKLQTRAADLHANAAAIRKQDSDVRRATAGLADERAKWNREVVKATRRLNEVGDLQNWAEVLEREFLVLEETVRLVEASNPTATTATATTAGERGRGGGEAV